MQRSASILCGKWNVDFDVDGAIFDTFRFILPKMFSGARAVTCVQITLDPKRCLAGAWRSGVDCGECVVARLNVMVCVGNHNRIKKRE